MGPPQWTLYSADNSPSVFCPFTASKATRALNSFVNVFLFFNLLLLSGQENTLTHCLIFGVHYIKTLVNKYKQITQGL